MEQRKDSPAGGGAHKACRHPTDHGRPGGTGQVVDQDRATDADLVPEKAGGGEFGLEGIVGPHPVSLAGIDEHPGGIRVPLGSFAKQRTLC